MTLAGVPLTGRALSGSPSAPTQGRNWGDFGRAYPRPHAGRMSASRHPLSLLLEGALVEAASCFPTTTTTKAHTRTKTGLYDDTVVLGIGYLGPPLGQLAAKRPGERRLWDLLDSQSHLSVAEARDLLGVEVGSYEMVHGGPSHEIAARKRGGREVQQRGRWAAQRSVRRHQKAGRLIKALYALPQSVRSFGEDIAEHPSDYYSREQAPPPLPRH